MKLYYVLESLRIGLADFSEVGTQTPIQHFRKPGCSSLKKLGIDAFKTEQEAQEEVNNRARIKIEKAQKIIDKYLKCIKESK